MPNRTPPNELTDSNEYGISTSTEAAPDQNKPRTPLPNANTQTIKATPARQHSMHTNEFRSGGLQAMREAILRDVDYSVPMISMKSFTDYLLPPLKKGIDVERLVSTLHELNEIISKDNCLVLKDFVTNPGAQNQRKDEVFAPLENLFNTVVKLASQTTRTVATFDLRLLPDIPLESDRHGKTRPDAYFITVEAERRVRRARKIENMVRWWYDIGPTKEFKKRATTKDRNQNISQIAFNIQQIMSLDPCRRFTFGTTIEDTSTCLWFVSRAAAFVSEEFDITKDVTMLLHVLLSIAFASKEELGWDTTITPTIQNRVRQYRIRVGTEMYETEELLSDSAADALISRASRVWKVKRCNSRSSERFALKDIWVDDDRKLEHEIYDTILCDVEKKYGREGREEVAGHLLRPKASWLVKLSNKKVDDTADIMRGFKPELSKGYKLRVDVPRDEVNRSRGPAVVADMEDKSSERIVYRQFRLACKRHYRIVFEQVAMPLHALKKLSDAFTVLKDSTKVFEYINGSGWVHRDIGVTNLYFYNGQGLIGDLEYAKRKDSNITHEVRSCIMDCMPTEAIRNKYKYAELENEEERISTVMRTANAIKDGKIPARGSASTNSFHFSYNDLHDMESLWWAAIWEIFFYRDTSDVRNETSESDSQRIHFTHELFPRTHEVESRGEFLGDKNSFQEALAWTSDGIKPIVHILDSIHGSLVSKYRVSEAQLPLVNEGAFGDIHERLRSLFELCEMLSKDIGLMPFKSNGFQHPLLSQAAGVQIDDSTSQAHPDTYAMVGLTDNMAALNLGDIAIDNNNDRLTPMPPPRVRYGLEVLNV